MPFANAFEKLSETARREFWALLALKYTPKLGLRSCKRLLTTFGSAYNALQQKHSWHEAEVAKDKAQSLASEAWRNPAKQEWLAAQTMAGDIVLWTDARYPSPLRELPDPPLLLYCQGDTSLLLGPCVAVVGMRSCSDKGAQLAASMGSALAAHGITVVSGLALGIDSAAQEAALTLPGRTIAVLGNGIAHEYPRSNANLQRTIARQGLLVSEFSPSMKPDSKNFPIRNRIISGLSLGVLVIEAFQRSGSLITARLALEQNRSVYAISGTIGDPKSAGCQELIRQGAQPIFSSQDIINDLALQLKDFVRPDVASCTDQKPSTTSPNAVSKKPFATQDNAPKNHEAPNVTPTDHSELVKLLLVALAQDIHDIDALCQHLNQPPAIIMSTLVQLELQGRVRRLPNNRYGLP